MLCLFWFYLEVSTFHRISWETRHCYMIHPFLLKLWFDSTSQQVLVKHLPEVSSSLRRIKLNRPKFRSLTSRSLPLMVMNKKWTITVISKEIHACDNRSMYKVGKFRGSNEASQRGCPCPPPLANSWSEFASLGGTLENSVWAIGIVGLVTQVEWEPAHDIWPQAHNAQKSLFLLQTSKFSSGSLEMWEKRRQGATTTVAKKERVGLSL